MREILINLTWIIISLYFLYKGYCWGIEHEKVNNLRRQIDEQIEYSKRLKSPKVKKWLEEVNRKLAS